MASKGRKYKASDIPSAQAAARPRRRRQDEKGLPDDGAILAMAVTYLEIQRQLWPELVAAKVLPAKTDKQAAQRLVGESRNAS